MSDNKNVHFRVTQTVLVKALNKGEAAKIARKGRGKQVLWSDTNVDRIPATEARSIAG